MKKGTHLGAFNLIGRGRIPLSGPVQLQAASLLTYLACQIIGILLPLFADKNRTRQVPIRTISFIPCQIKIPLSQTVPVYQKLAPKIKELKALGMSQEVIANKLDVNVKTIRKGVLFND